jgi:hypothetical protein
VGLAAWWGWIEGRNEGGCQNPNPVIDPPGQRRHA